MGPDFGQVKDIPSELLRVDWIKDLHVASPRWVLTLVDGVEKILGVPIRVFRSHVAGFLVGEVFDSLVRLAMDLDILEAAIRFGKLVSMTRVAIHVTVRVRSSSIAEKLHDLVARFLVGREVIPKHSSIL